MSPTAFCIGIQSRGCRIQHNGLRVCFWGIVHWFAKHTESVAIYHLFHLRALLLPTLTLFPKLVNHLYFCLVSENDEQGIGRIYLGMHARDGNISHEWWQTAVWKFLIKRVILRNPLEMTDITWEGNMFSMLYLLSLLGAETLCSSQTGDLQRWQNLFYMPPCPARGLLRAWNERVGEEKQSSSNRGWRY